MTEISAWLEHLGLGRYAAAFVENAIDLDVLPDLTDADFERLGVPLGHRKRMIRAISSSVINSRGAAVGFNSTSHRPEAERRQLTVLFCDLVGSTALAVRLDPEDLSAVIRRFQMTSTGVITSYGGYVAKFMGDGLLAYFGYPVTHEDEAESAVRAGLDLVAKVGRLLLPSGEALQVRVGVATGLVVLANNAITGSADEVAATGENSQSRRSSSGSGGRKHSCRFGGHPQIARRRFRLRANRATVAERIHRADQRLQNHRRERG